MRAVAILLITSACNGVFSLEQTHALPDAPPPLDTDGDGVPDATDNCISASNESQSDADEDGLGDPCDNCPLVGNRAQESFGDPDPVGDICDPRPLTDGDCLVLVDTFSGIFETHWRVHHEGVAPSIVATDGTVTIDPDGTTRVAVSALHDDGSPLEGFFDVQLRGMHAPKHTGLYAGSRISDARTGNACGVGHPNPTAPISVIVRSEAFARAIGASELSSDPVGSELLVRMLDQPSTVECRVDYGFALGLLNLSPGTGAPVAGSPGALVIAEPGTIDAIALYRSQPGTACAPTVYR